MSEKLEEDKDGLGATVASHYNQLQETGVEARKESRIYYMRGFNNWVKSTLINDFMEKVRRKAPSGSKFNILDLASGKGGDQRKWKIAKVHRVVHADIAATSVQQSEERYNEMKKKQNPRYPIFDAEFHAIDCSKERLRERLSDPSMQFDLTSCQFSYHYSFESLEQADLWMRNACENLKPGGFFIGTTPDARELMRRLKESDSNSFGNDVYRVTFDSTTDFPLFGCKYDFHLEGVVDCPEFLVHFGTLEKIAEKYGMIPVYKENFATLFEQRIKDSRNVDLLKRMNALEEYPAARGKQLVAVSEDAYQKAADKLKELNESGDSDSNRHKVLTISRDEWEAITVYLAFAFQKLGTPAPEDEEYLSQSPADSEEPTEKRKLSDSDAEEESPTKKPPPAIVT